MNKLIGGIAIAALAIGTAAAQPGGGQGNAQGRGHDDHSNHPGQSAGHHDTGQGASQDRGKGQGSTREREPRGQGADRPNGQDRGRSADRPDRPVHSEEQRHGRGPDRVSPDNRGGGRDGVPGMARSRDRDDDRARPGPARILWNSFDNHGHVQGCPPGLAKKNNGCMPPGLARQDGWTDRDASWWGLRSLRDLAGYRYHDGSLVRLGPNGAIIAFYPLLGGALAPGNRWPDYYRPVPLAPYYVDYYDLGDDYRYHDGALYRVDSESMAIASIAALLTGDDFVVGSPMPSGYDVYNVPWDHRERYRDGPDAWYRYSDGHVYEVDPETRLIVAAIELLT